MYPFCSFCQFRCYLNTINIYFVVFLTLKAQALCDVQYFLQDFSEECDDLTKDFPDGASSIMVQEHSEPWQVFTDVQFNGEIAYLYPGDYSDLEEIKLKSAVKSFRRAPVRHFVLNTF